MVCRSSDDDNDWEADGTDGGQETSEGWEKEVALA